MPRAGASARFKGPRTIKVSDEVHQQLQHLVSEVNENGWQHLGVSRRDTPTISNVIEEGLLRLKKSGLKKK